MKLARLERWANILMRHPVLDDDDRVTLNRFLSQENLSENEQIVWEDIIMRMMFDYRMGDDL